MSIFKIGDKIKRINRFHMLPAGIYTVIDTSMDNMIKIEEYNTIWYDEDNFELYKEPSVEIKPNKEHVHKDMIMAWAGGEELEYSYNKRFWNDVDKNGYHGDQEKIFFDPKAYYRIKQRKFPETTLTDAELSNVYSVNTSCHLECLRKIANAAIKQYILENESKS